MRFNYNYDILQKVAIWDIPFYVPDPGMLKMIFGNGATPLGSCLSRLTGLQQFDPSGVIIFTNYAFSATMFTLKVILQVINHFRKYEWLGR